MKKKIVGKYIIYVNEEYLSKLYKGEGACTQERRIGILRQVFEEITAFIQSGTSRFSPSSREGAALLAYSFTDSEGKERKSFEIHPLLNANTLAYRMRLSNQKRKKPY